MRFIKIILASLVLASSVGCTRIQTGEVGVRVDMSRQIQGNELNPGSWNQTIIGDVLTFPVKDITINIENKTPMTSDNSALSDFDMTVVYSINPTSVAELYSTKSKAFHAFDSKENDTFLMYNFMQTLVNNAAYKSVRQYKSLEIADNRAKIEGEIQAIVADTLKAEKLDSSLTLTMVQIRNIAPNKEIMDSANQYVKSVNDIKVKENDVKLAKLESERMAALASNSTQSISYMQAQAQMLIAKGVSEGKVQTIIVPVDFRGMVNVGK